MNSILLQYSRNIVAVCVCVLVMVNCLKKWMTDGVSCLKRTSSYFYYEVIKLSSLSLPYFLLCFL